MNNKVGDIIIGTKVDNSGLQKGLKETKQELNQFDKTSETKVKIKVDYDEQSIREKIMELQDKMQKIINDKVSKNVKINGKNVKITGLGDFEEEERAKNIAEQTEEYKKLQGELSNYQIQLQKIIDLKETERYKSNEAFIEEYKQRQLLNQKNNEPKLTKVEETKPLENVFDFNDVTSYTAQISLLENKLNDLEATYNILANEPGFDENKQDALELKVQIEKVINQINILKGKEKELNQGHLFTGMNEELKKMSNNINSIIKKVGKWALAVFSIRSAYMFVRQAMSTLSEYNDTLATKVQNIRLVLAVGLEPLIERLVNLVVKLLSYLNYITKSWFGIDLFARAAELSTSKMKDNMAGAAGSAKEIRKQLAGFDEMNIIGDNVDASGGSGGISASNIEPFLLEEAPVPKWFTNIADWIKEHKNEIITFLETIGGLILGLKIAKVAKDVWNFVSGLLGIGSSGAAASLEAIADKLGVISALVIGIYDVYNSFQSLSHGSTGISDFFKGWSKLANGDIDAEYLHDMAEGYDEVNKGIDYGQKVLKLYQFETGGGFADIFTSLTNGGRSFIGTIYDMGKSFQEWDKGLLEEKIKAVDLYYSIKDLDTATKDYNASVTSLTSATNTYENAIDRQEEAQRRLTEIENQQKEKLGDLYISGEQLYNSVQKGTLDYKNMTTEQRELYKAYKNNLEATEQVKTAEENLKTASYEASMATEDLRLAEVKQEEQNGKGVKAWEEYRDSIIDAYNNGEIEAEDAARKIDKAAMNIDQSARKTFVDSVPDKIKNAFKTPKEVQELDDAMSNLGSTMPDNMKETLNKAIRAANKVIGAINWTGLYKIIGNKQKIAEIPLLAKGGIINMPGRGIPVGNAIAGEAGREGVLPLTDERAMAMLGREIGKWISINANIPVSIGNRQIGRVVKQIIADDEFAMNS